MLELLPEAAVTHSSLERSAVVGSACGCTWDPEFCGTELPKDAGLGLVVELRRAEGVEGCGCDARVLEGIRARSVRLGERQCPKGSGWRDAGIGQRLYIQVQTYTLQTDTVRDAIRADTNGIRTGPLIRRRSALCVYPPRTRHE